MVGGGGTPVSAPSLANAPASDGSKGLAHSTLCANVVIRDHIRPCFLLRDDF